MHGDAQSHICLNYRQCGSTFTPGICANPKIDISFSIDLTKFTPKDMDVDTPKVKCCVDGADSDEALALLGLAHPEDAELIRMEANRQRSERDKSTFLAGMGVGVVGFVAPMLAITLLVWTCRRKRIKNALLG
jgi:hypothetical protein